MSVPLCTLSVQACSSFSDGGVCVRACSNEYVYNSEDRSVTLNTEHKLRTGYFCVNTCPGVCGYARCVNRCVNVCLCYEACVGVTVIGELCSSI